MKELKSNDWVNFYKDRVNSSYQSYFNQRYRVFIEAILSLSQGRTIVDGGCAIGSVSKSLPGLPRYGFDLNEEMVNLAKKNVSDVDFFVRSIFDYLPSNNDLLVTHGLLEHFDDKEILDVVDRPTSSVHYVPLDKYKSPSFGDERLLSADFWISLTNPTQVLRFNKGYDLCLIYIK